MEPSIEATLETMNINGQQQPLSVQDGHNTDSSDLDKILDNILICPSSIYGVSLGSFDSNNDNDQFDVNDSNNSSADQIDGVTFLENQLSETSIDKDLLDFLASVERDGSQQSTFTENYGQTNLNQSQQSTFIESYDLTNNSQSQQLSSPQSSLAAGSSPIEQIPIDNLIYAQDYVAEQEKIYRAATKPKKNKTSQNKSRTVGPVDYILHSGGCQPCTTVQMQNDYAYQQQVLEYDAVESKKIQIKSQPRSKFRPRTQNESKNSSHYIRCDDGVKPEYPTIHIHPTWAFQSDVNLIEVALMGIDKQPHPYTIDNKTRSDTFEDNALVFKQNDPNVLYFRLTNEDYQNGFKTFMIELIKSKQDDVITKDLIRSRQLEHSMLRFTRIYQVGKGDFQRDDAGEEYSSVMTEAYGDVDIEHMGPRYGPMCGQEMVYIVLKGRILKNDLTIDVAENMTGWSYRVDNFTKNGNVVYFLMPAFPFPQVGQIRVDIIISYKGEELPQFSYLYKGSLDQDLAELRLNDPNTTSASSSMSKNFDPIDFFMATGAGLSSKSRKTSTPKPPKRLNKK